MRNPTFPGRLRNHEASHVRTIEQQMLDALLRIEELLKPQAAQVEPAPQPQKGKRK